MTSFDHFDAGDFGHRGDQDFFPERLGLEWSVTRPFRAEEAILGEATPAPPLDSDLGVVDSPTLTFPEVSSRTDYDWLNVGGVAVNTAEPADSEVQDGGENTDRRSVVQTVSGAAGELGVARAVQVASTEAQGTEEHLKTDALESRSDPKDGKWREEQIITGKEISQSIPPEPETGSGGQKPPIDPLGKTGGIEEPEPDEERRDTLGKAVALAEDNAAPAKWESGKLLPAFRQTWDALAKWAQDNRTPEADPAAILGRNRALPKYLPGIFDGKLSVGQIAEQHGADPVIVGLTISRALDKLMRNAPDEVRDQLPRPMGVVRHPVDMDKVGPQMALLRNPEMSELRIAKIAGVSHSTVHRFFKGQAHPDGPSAVAIMAAAGVPQEAIDENMPYYEAERARMYTDHARKQIPRMERRPASEGQPSIDPATFGAWLREALTASGRKLREVAAEINVQPATLTSLLSGGTAISDAVLRKYLSSVGATQDQIEAILRAHPGVSEQIYEKQRARQQRSRS